MDSFFYRNTRAFYLALMLIVAMGLSGFLTIGRQEDPTITNIFATVLTPWPGANPARVEALVTEKIEGELRDIAAIAEIGSVSRTGLSVVQIELDELLPKDQIEVAWTDIRNALDDAQIDFPTGVLSPELRNDSGGTFTAISALTQRPGDVPDVGLLSRLAEDLRDRLQSLPGADTVEVYGAANEEILVSVDPIALTGLGVAIDQVSDAIAAADAKFRAGQTRGESLDMVVELNGEIDDLERIRDIPLIGAPALRVGDVAEVSLGAQDPPESLSYYNGAPATLIAARMAPDLQVDAWMGSVRDELDGFGANLPAGVSHQLIFDQSNYTNERFASLATNMGIGVGLVVTVLFVTLGLRAAIVVGAAIPLAGLMSIYVMNLAGISIHQMSVTGLIVALGLLVDGAIVMTDEVRRRLQDGASRLEAVGGSVRRLATPLLASTFTTVLAFAPMALLPGPVGDFVGSIAKSVIIMLASSFVLALTITPAIAGWLLPDAETSGRTRWWRDGLRAPWLERAFAASITASLRYPLLSIVFALALPVAGFLSFPTLTAQFFPGADRNQFHVQMRLSGEAAIAATDKATARADAILRETPGVAQVAWVVGESAPAFYYNMSMDQDGVSGFAEALVTTDSPEATAAIIPDLQDRLDAALPQAQVIVRDLVQGPPVAAPIEVRFVGQDLATLRALGERTRAIMAETPGITQTRAALSGGPPKIELDLDADRVAAAGLTLADVAGSLNAQLDGAIGGSLLEGGEELPVRVRIDAASRSAADTLADLQVLGPDARNRALAGAYPGVPLTALGDVALRPSESPINRLDGERINLVQAFVAYGVLPEEALSSLRARLAAEPDFPPQGYRIEYGGDSDARADTVNNLMATLAMVVVLTLATLVLAFRSFRLTAITLAVAVLAMGLSILALALFRYPFGINALIGVIGSIGVSINAAIIVLSALCQDARARAGDLTAMRDVVTRSSRHIVSTTITTFGGFLPLILSGGGFWPPFAMAVAGGVLLSTVVSFYFTPPMFRLLMRPGAQSDSAPEALPAPA